MNSFWPNSRIPLSVTQLDVLKKQGCQQVFTGKVSGSNHPIPPLNNCLNRRARDSVIDWKLAGWVEILRSSSNWWKSWQKENKPEIIEPTGLFNDRYGNPLFSIHVHFV